MKSTDALFARPVAHRGLHDLAAGRPENSRAAIKAAIENGYGVEIDLQPSFDGVAMVFHDYDMARLTGTPGAIGTLSAADLQTRTLLGADEGIPTLAEVLALVDGQVPLFVEIKDQDGAMGPNVGALEAAAAEALAGYAGPLAVMSFNPHSVAALQDLMPDVPRGLVTCGWTAEDWPLVPEVRRAELRGLPDLDRLACAFISHDVRDLSTPQVTAQKAAGRHILCWTVRSAAVEAEARQVADQVTFEGYLA
ncbi:glycerophosphodiester phosphodiesterase family protein [Pseudaestuariivita sp.]|uniref:glycerophosphodiester phosphodiesterase family protein n=1 Tax=Pseudaestuariivita sp. TaxID=2211669 RepID=UPI004057D32C